MQVRRKMNSHSSEFRNAFRDTILRLGYDGIKSISGTDVEDMLRPLLDGYRPKGRRNGLADIATDTEAWTVKTMYYPSPTEDYADVIMGRVSTLAAAKISDPLKDINLTAETVSNEWNRRVLLDQELYGDIRTMCLLRHKHPRKVTLFEGVTPILTPDYRWILRTNNTILIGAPDGRQFGTWQPTGGQLRFLYTIPPEAITVELAGDEGDDEA